MLYQSQIKDRTMKNHVEFTILIQKEDDWFVATEPISSVASQGKTCEEALSNLKEALELFYEDNTYENRGEYIFTTLEVTI